MLACFLFPLLEVLAVSPQLSQFRAAQLAGLCAGGTMPAGLSAPLAVAIADRCTHQFSGGEAI